MDNAFERARAAYGTGAYDDATLEFLFPQLKESEDERIIRAIIDALYSHSNSINLLSSRGYQMGDIEAWLEKQKELFESGRGLYYYDGEKTTYCGYLATEENPYDFAISQQEKQKEQKPWKVGANAYFTPEQKPAEWDDWSTFRREAAKDFMSAIITREAPQYNFACRNVADRVTEAIMWADELIKQLKEEQK